MEHWRHSRWLFPATLFVAFAMSVWDSVASLTGLPEADLAHPLIFESAWFAMAWWFLAAFLRLLAVRMGPGLRPAAERNARWFNTVGMATFLVHLAVAFHLGHAWSHASAVEHVREAGGFGEGIFVSHLFTVVWAVEVVWSWLAFESYLTRPRWVSFVVYGFLAFVVFNATVVFAVGWPRWASLLVFVALAFAMACTWRAGSFVIPPPGRSRRGLGSRRRPPRGVAGCIWRS
jgi:hypothetical protein